MEAEEEVGVEKRFSGKVPLMRFQEVKEEQEKEAEDEITRATES